MKTLLLIFVFFIDTFHIFTSAIQVKTQLELPLNDSIPYENSTNVDNSNYDDDNTQSLNPSSSYSSTLVIIIGIIIIFLIFFAIYYLKKRRTALNEMMILDPETQIKPQELSSAEKVYLKKWIFNPVGDLHADDVQVTDEINPLGTYHILEFKQSKGIGRAIISNKAIDKHHDNCYMEIEISDLDDDIDIALGLCSKTEFKSNIAAGITSNGVSIHSRGKVYFNQQMRVDYGFNVRFGETLGEILNHIGIGYRFNDGKVWLFYNGSFLNEPAIDGRKSSKLSSSAYITPNKLDSFNKNKSSERMVNKSFDEEEKERQIISDAGKIALNINEKYYPVIYANGYCVLTLNIGGAPFRISQHEIAKGLLQ